MDCHYGDKDSSLTFFKNRPCPEIKFKCLEDKKESGMKLPDTPYVPIVADYAQIEEGR